jgi:hypothetical protein
MWPEGLVNETLTLCDEIGCRPDKGRHWTSCAQWGVRHFLENQTGAKKNFTFAFRIRLSLLTWRSIGIDY